MRMHRQFTAWAAVAALVAATVYAPLFHVHSDSGEAPVLHAHFPELEIGENENVVHMESAHSHATARSIDILTTVACDFIHFDASLQSSSLILPDPQPSRGFVMAAAPRAHAPPSIRFLIPRAPPA
jgi:hypothetical protein